MTALVIWFIKTKNIHTDDNVDDYLCLCLLLALCAQQLWQLQLRPGRRSRLLTGQPIARWAQLIFSFTPHAFRLVQLIDFHWTNSHWQRQRFVAFKFFIFKLHESFLLPTTATTTTTMLLEFYTWHEGSREIWTHGHNKVALQQQQ